MIHFLLPGVIILIALTAIIIVIVRHFPQAAAIDVDSLPAEQEAIMKAALMERRLKRKILDFKKKLMPIFRKFGQLLSKIWGNFHKRIEQLEQRYRQKPHTMTTEQQEDVKQKIRHLLDLAKKAVEEDKLSEGETKYIEVLSWDPKNFDAYFGLGEVYMEKKEFAQAKETWQYLIRLIQSHQAGEEKSKFSNPLSDTQVTEVYYDYALCLQIGCNLEEAKQQLDIVIDRESNNPKYLDKVVEINIVLKNKESARKAYDALKSVNPENQKLASLDDQIRKL